MRPQHCQDSFNSANRTREVTRPGHPLAPLSKTAARARRLRVQRRHQRLHGELRLLRRRTEVDRSSARQPAADTAALLAARVSRATDAMSCCWNAASTAASCSASEASAMMRGALRASGVRVGVRASHNRAYAAVSAAKRARTRLPSAADDRHARGARGVRAAARQRLFLRLGSKQRAPARIGAPAAQQLHPPLRSPTRVRHAAGRAPLLGVVLIRHGQSAPPSRSRTAGDARDGWTRRRAAAELHAAATRAARACGVLRPRASN